MKLEISNLKEECEDGPSICPKQKKILLCLMNLKFTNTVCENFSEILRELQVLPEVSSSQVKLSKFKKSSQN